MSWLDKVNTDLVITMGDGKEYRPEYMNANKGVEYNVSVFEFKEISGSLVYRGLPRGRRYAIELYFQGEDHLDTALAFEQSAANPKPWKMYHPLYGGLLVQPTGVLFDNADQNVTRITGELIETINTDATPVMISAPDKIKQNKDALDESFASAYATDVDVEAIDRVHIKTNIDNFFSNISGIISDSTDFSDFYNAYNEANTTLNKASFDTLQLIKQVQQVVNMPQDFTDTLANRLRMFGLQLSFLNRRVADIVLAHDKRLYMNNAAMAVSAMTVAAVTYNSYSNRREVIDVVDILYAAFNNYMDNLDALQSATGAGLNAFIPNPLPVTQLSNLISYGISALFNIAADAKQEITITLEEDSDIIQLARRFYGLKPDDSTIDYFKSTNNIGISEIFNIRKGRSIVYYV